MIWGWNRRGEAGERLGAADGDAAISPSPAAAGASVMSAVAAALPDPFLVLDRQSRVLFANRHAREALDADPTGQHITAAIRAPAVLEAIAKVLAEGEPARADYDRRVPVERHFEAFIAPVQPAGAEPSPAGTPALLILLRDLTRQHQVERLRADFVANASHELRTPLASLVGFVDTLLGPARDDEKARRRFLELMKAQADRIRRLIDDLLSLSRIEMLEHDRPTTVVDMGDVVRQAAETLSGLASENGVELVVDVVGELPVRGDADDLVQVMHNLIENAIRYGASGKRVEVSGGAAEGSGMVEVQVRDFGPGIGPEHLPRLTERFYRVSVEESRARGGTGLGLAIVKHILNRHRGRLVIASEPGEGSTFTVRLPRAEAA